MLSIFIVYSKCRHEYKKKIFEKEGSLEILKILLKIRKYYQKTQFKHLDLEKTDEIRNYLI